MSYKQLLQFEGLTPRQKEILEACQEYGTQKKASKHLGISIRNIESSVSRARQSAARSGWSPDHDFTHQLPDPHIAAGISTCYGADGEIRQQWVKSKLDKDISAERLEEMMYQASKVVSWKMPKVKAPRKVDADLMNVVAIGDAHVGMYAWSEETGKDFDINIASRELKESFCRLLDKAPPADTCIILQLGDFFHGDDWSNQTKQSGHALDIDTRHERVFQVGVAIMNSLVARALESHKKVVIRNVRGNHDPVTSMALKFQMEAFWKDEKRVVNEMTPSPLWTYEFGDVSILATHGNAPKPDKLPEVFSGHYPELWGRTKYRYIHHGHFHSKAVFDRPGVRVEGFCNLAPNDAWHHSAGYISPQEITLIVYHKSRGEVRRSIERPEIPEHIGKAGGDW